jgi:hypothetical protein
VRDQYLFAINSCSLIPRNIKSPSPHKDEGIPFVVPP